MRRFKHVLAFTLAIAGGLQCLCLGQQPTIETTANGFTQHVVEGVGKAASESRTKLYDDAKPDEIKPDEIKPDEVKDSDYGFKLDDDFRKRRAATAYPSLYRPGNATGVIIVVGFEQCGLCKQFLSIIPGGNGALNEAYESKLYRVMYVDRFKNDPLNKSKDAPNWQALVEKFGLPAMYPTIMVVEKGRMTKAFSGFKPWVVVKGHAEAAKKEIDKDEENKQERRRFLNWLFSQNGSGGVDSGAFSYYGASPPTFSKEAPR